MKKRLSFFCHWIHFLLVENWCEAGWRLKTSCFPETNNAFNLGNSSFYFNYAYLNNIISNSIVGNGANSTTKILVQNATSSNVFTVDTTNNQVITQNIISVVDNNYTLGNTVNYWKNIYTNIFFFLSRVASVQFGRKRSGKML